MKMLRWDSTRCRAQGRALARQHEKKIPEWHGDSSVFSSKELNRHTKNETAEAGERPAIPGEDSLFSKNELTFSVRN